ncbi:MAG TPA: hypothetical protein V6D19_06535 [Stenomitos sp.]
MNASSTKSKATVKTSKYIDGHQYSLILQQSRPSIKEGSHFSAERLQAIASKSLRNGVLEAVSTNDDNRYSVSIRLSIPIGLTKAEVDWLLEKTDSWDGWGDSPSESLALLGGLIEDAIAIASVGGAN